jgi:hypothetical protein
MLAYYTNKMLTEANNFSPKVAIHSYICDSCDYNTCKYSDYKKHLLTPKHKKLTNANEKIAKSPEEKTHACSCGKEYKHASSLSKHKKLCVNIDNLKKICSSPEIEKNDIINDNINDNDISSLTDKELILMLVKQNAEIVKENSELKYMMMDVIKNGTHNTTNNNCNNKTFNLQLFLNETCKDAMNIMDFVDSIKLQLSDLESVGELGYVKGLSNIIVKNLRALDVTKRPVHCSDAKREILYVKDNDVWEKEDVENSKMKKAVKYIAYKNTKLLPLWKQTYPECMQYDSSKNDKYNYMVIEAMGGMGDNEGEKINKIIKQIAKEVVIEK